MYVAHAHTNTITITHGKYKQKNLCAWYIFSSESEENKCCRFIYIYSTQTPIQLQSNLVYINRNTIHIYINIYSYVMFTYVNLNMYCA